MKYISKHSQTQGKFQHFKSLQYHQGTSFLGQGLYLQTIPDAVCLRGFFVYDVKAEFQRRVDRKGRRQKVDRRVPSLERKEVIIYDGKCIYMQIKNTDSIIWNERQLTQCSSSLIPSKILEASQQQRNKRYNFNENYFGILTKSCKCKMGWEKSNCVSLKAL